MTSIFKPEVELMMFLRMRSNEIAKNAENGVKMAFGGLIYGVYMFFGTGNPNLSFILKPEVELVMFVRMRSNQKSRTTAKTSLNCR